MKGSTAASRIALFGNFGTGNLGNDATLRAMVENLRRIVPAADIVCVCPARGRTVLGEIEAIPMRAPIRFWKQRRDGSPQPRETGLTEESAPAQHWLASAVSSIRDWLRVCLWPFTETYRWFRGIRALAGRDLLIMTGTGMLGDYAITPLGLHYDIFRWTLIARLCRCKVLFVGVGSGPIRHPLSRYFVRVVLALADYRSYRDDTSRLCLDAIGGRVANDLVCPDLAFSLPVTHASVTERVTSPQMVIGVGLLNYHDRRGRSVMDDSAYRNYIAHLASFVGRLCDGKFRVRLLIGDVVWDQRVIRDLRDQLAQRAIKYRENLISDSSACSISDLLEHISSVDIVVSSRYHNVVLALLLGKPAIAISYHEKFKPLMESVAMGGYCQDIEQIDVETLIGKILTIRDNRRLLCGRIVEEVDRMRLALEEQYVHIAQLTQQHGVSNNERLVPTLISCMLRG